MKKVLATRTSDTRHWVGDGFPVRTLFSYNDEHAATLSPFLLVDYAGPAAFSPTSGQRGVGQHPHRGFETVTIVYQGEVAHRDSAGNGGVIGAGDVQWMTAGSGILHEEYHSPRFSRQGGTLQMVQLWVNLPAREKMTGPAYQSLLDAQIPEVDLPGGAGAVRVIAGDHDGHRGPAVTRTPMQVLDIRLTPGAGTDVSVPDGWGAGVVVLEGTVQVNGSALAREGQLVVLDVAGSRVRLEANNPARLLLLSGEPLDEPVVGHGPFVMNTAEEIREAIHDFQSGRFARAAQ